MKLLYNSKTGEIYDYVGKNVNIMRRYRDYPKEILDNLGEILEPNTKLERREYINYKVVDGELIKRPNIEVQELNQYGKILTLEERQLNKLKPSPEEISKAKNTIEILTTIQEVM